MTMLSRLVAIAVSGILLAACGGSGSGSVSGSGAGPEPPDIFQKMNSAPTLPVRWSERR